MGAVTAAAPAGHGWPGQGWSLRQVWSGPLVVMNGYRGAPTSGPRGPGPPLVPENAIFSEFLPLNYAISIFKDCFLKLFAKWED